MISKKGQQEMVGFVLIIVLIVIGLFVFLIISSGQRDSVKAQEGHITLADNMLSAIMKTTTECAVIYEPDYADVRGLFVAEFKNDYCSNLGKTAKEYLNESLYLIMEDILATESEVGAYELRYYVEDEDDYRLVVYGGSCGGTLYESRPIKDSINRESLVVILKICVEK